MSIHSLSPVTLSLLINRCNAVDRLDRRLQKQAAQLRTHIHLNAHLRTPNLEWLGRYKRLDHLIGTFYVVISYIPASVRQAVTTLQLPFTSGGDHRSILDILASDYPAVMSAKMWSGEIENSSVMLYSLGSREESNSTEAIPSTQIAWMKTREHEITEPNLQTLMLVVVDDDDGPSRLNCENLTILSTGTIDDLSHLPRLEVLILQSLPNLDSMTLLHLRSLAVATVMGVDLYQLQRFSPSLTSLSVASMLAVTLLTSRLPRSLTNIDIGGNDSPRVILDPTLPLLKLRLRACELAGILPPTLIELHTGRLAMIEVSHCHRLKRLTCEPGVYEEEWPSTLTELNVRIKPPYELPSTLPSRLKRIALWRNGPFPYPLTGLLSVRFNGSFTLEQLGQFRGNLLISNNTEDELNTVNAALPYAVVGKYSA